MSRVQRFARACVVAGIVAIGVLACPSSPHVEVPAGEPCGQGDECQAGWLCFQGICREVCNGHRDCPRTHACEPGVCIPVDDYECDEDIDCDAPPACQSVLHAECYAGSCHYSPMDAGTPCDDGSRCTSDDQCDSAGTCVGEPMACDQPPADFCFQDDSWFREYARTGTCNQTNGLCEYDYDEYACANCGLGCLGLPEAPGNLHATAGDTQVTLTWTPVSDALSYKVYVSETEGGTAGAEPVDADSATFVHTSLTNGTTYYYAVSVVVALGEGELSAEVSATPRISAPTNVNADGGIAEVTVTWDTVPGADSYKVYWAVEPGGTASSVPEAGVTLPFTHTSREHGTTYYYAVTAVDGPSESVLSAEVSATTASLPGVPENVAAVAGDAQVTLSWDAIAGALSYNLYVSETEGDTSSAEPVSVSSPSHVHTALTNGTTYYFAVSAVTQVGEGDLSPEASATPRISAPARVSAYGDFEKVTLTWDSVPGADAYDVFWAKEPGVTMRSDRSSDVTSPYVHEPATNNTTYYFAVVALDGPSESVLSGEVSAATAIDTADTLVASDAQADDQFGHRVALDGDYAIVGAPFADGGAGLSDAGAAYVFHRTAAGTWDAGVKLVAGTPQAGMRFGTSVGISGDRAIVGGLAAPARVFERTDVNAWDNVYELSTSGVPVAISGDYAVVGAFADNAYQGAAFVYRRTTYNWTLDTKLVAPVRLADEWFGHTVAISGEYAIIGSRFDDTGDGEPDIGLWAGAAYAFHRTAAGTWDAGTLLASSHAYASRLSYSVAVSGDFAIVGRNSHFGAGSAYVFHLTGTNTWDAGSLLVPHDGQNYDDFGSSVAISGDYAIVGTPGDDDAVGPSSYAGAAYLFHHADENGWDLGTKLVAADAQAGDSLGVSVALSNGSAIVATELKNGGEGAAYVYDY